MTAHGIGAQGARHTLSHSRSAEPDAHLTTLGRPIVPKASQSAEAEFTFLAGALVARAVRQRVANERMLGGAVECEEGPGLLRRLVKVSGDRALVQAIFDDLKRLER